MHVTPLSAQPTRKTPGQLSCCEFQHPLRGRQKGHTAQAGWLTSAVAFPSSAEPTPCLFCPVSNNLSCLYPLNFTVQVREISHFKTDAWAMTSTKLWELGPRTPTMQQRDTDPVSSLLQDQEVSMGLIYSWEIWRQTWASP